MQWIVVAIFAHFLTALAVIIDKFLLGSKRISHPSTYAFFTGAMSLFTLVLAPWGFHLISLERIGISFVSGIIFVYGILFVFKAIQIGEASRVNPVVGTTIPIATYLLSFVLLSESMSSIQLAGVGVLILGGWTIAWEFHPKKGGRFFPGFFQAILAGGLLALAFSIFKTLYAGDSFVNIFIWTRLGLVLGSASLLLFPAWRKIIFESLIGFKHPPASGYRTGFMFAFNKVLAGTGSILLNYAISLGSVTIVNALTVIEYAFVFIIGGLFSYWMPEIFRESRKFSVVIQKIAALAVICLGLWLVAK